MFCLWCGVAFSDAVALLEHITVRHAPTTTACQSVPASSPQPSTSSAVPPASVPASAGSANVCSVCDKVFQHSQSLKRHVRERHGAAEKVLCVQCGHLFASERTLQQHVKTKHLSDVKVKCSQCSKTFGRPYGLKCHLRGKRCPARRERFRCRHCRLKFVSLKALYEHKRASHPTRRRFACSACWRRFNSKSMHFQHLELCKKWKGKWERFQKLRSSRIASRDVQWETTSAVGGDARVHLLAITDASDLQLTLLNNRQYVLAMLKEDLKDLRRVKWYMTAFVRVKSDSKEVNGDSVRYMRCRPLTALREDELESQVGDGILGVINSFDNAQGEGSVLLFERVDKIELRVAKLSLLKGSSFIPLPEWLQNSSKGLINVQNFNDEKCFLYSVLAGLHLPAHPQRISSYKNRHRDVCMKDISYPVRVKDIDKFELQNENISVTVFGLEAEKTVVPLRVSQRLDRAHHINLLLLTGEDEDDDSHYVLVKNLSGFLSHLTRRKRALFWCENCLTPRDSEANHLEHRERCVKHDAQVIKMPTPKTSVMKFTDYEKQLRHDYVIYCDFECVLESFSTALPDPTRSSTTRLNRHVASGFCYVVVGPDGQFVKEPVLEHGEGDMARSLLLRLREEEEAITELRGEPFPIDMTPESEKLFESATVCYLCKDPVPRLGVKKVKDHNHRKEFDNYRGACCHGCNLNLKKRSFIPVFFHNFSGYDGHLILSAIGALSDGSDMSAIPKTKEKYISFSWGKLRFLNSFNFLSSSLDKLVKDLKPEDLMILQTLFPDKAKRELLSRKGVYPYSYFDSFKKFGETVMPPREAFKNDLSGADVADEDYDHALKVFEAFNMDSLWDYHDLYLLTDVLLLADVMETFRRVEMEHFQLDVVHFYTTPGLSWSAALLFTRQKLELLEDYDAHLMWEAGMRGGVATINCRKVEANNALVPETFDPSKPKRFIMYYDANNLYAKSMSRPLPVGSFRFLSKQEINEILIVEISESDEEGFLFEVDLSYPKHLHDLHNDFCLAPEHVNPSYDDLSPIQHRMIHKFGLSGKSTPKLIPNLRDKSNYIVFGTTLKLYLELGMVLKKIHRVLAFEQKAWLAPYINHNTEMRKKATSDFQKNLWKLKNNSVFGKTCERTRKRRNVQFTREAAKFRKLVKSPLFHSFDIFDHGLVCVERKKLNVCLNRPVYTGQVVLDVSKEIMYNFHYNCMKKRFGDKIKVCASDTDSLIYHIETDDVYSDMNDLKEWFDTSDYPKDHPLQSDVNKKVIGKFKDEMNGTAIKSFIGLRPKMYTFARSDSVVKCVGKGVPRAALKSQLSFSDYDKCLVRIKNKSVNFHKISSDHKHHLFTTFSTKKGLSCYDDKRFILEDNVHTLAFGHYSISGEDMDVDEDEGTVNVRELASLLDDYS